MDGWMDRTKIEGWLNGYKNRWMVGQTRKIQKDGWIDRKMDGTVEKKWMDG